MRVVEAGHLLTVHGAAVHDAVSRDRDDHSTRPPMREIVAKIGNSGHVARWRSMPRWSIVLALVLVAGGAFRADRAVHHGSFLSTDERAYAVLGIAVSHGHYSARHMNDPLHWPPGTPLLFAVARKLSGAGDGGLDPAALYVAQWLRRVGAVGRGV